MKLRKTMKIEVYNWPAANIIINPANMKIVVFVLSKKFLFNLEVGGAATGGACFF